MKHYVAMSGLHGCIPQSCEVYADRDDAVEGLAQIHDLGPYSTFKKNLKRNGYTELHLHEWRAANLYGQEFGPTREGHGAEYAEIQECDCLKPWEHSENVDSSFLRKVNNTYSLYERGIVSRESYLQALEELAQEFLNG